MSDKAQDLHRKYTLFNQREFKKVVCLEEFFSGATVQAACSVFRNHCLSAAGVNFEQKQLLHSRSIKLAAKLGSMDMHKGF